MAERFAIAFSDGPARELHRRTEDLEATFPWQSLRAADHSPAQLELARQFWTENALAEYASAIAMAQLGQALGVGRAPLDLWRLAADFASDELVHVELCARVAMQAGGAAALPVDPRAFGVTLDASLSPREQATELVLRVCCVGEALSLPLLAGNRRAATHPLTRAVLDRIVEDEARHARFGWLYLDWIGPALDDAERARLGNVASAEIRRLAPLWREATAARSAEAGVTAGGLGWMAQGEWAALARDTVEKSLRAPLARYGIDLDP